MGYVLLPLTLLVDVLAGYASYYYGASFLPWSWLVLAQFLWPVFLWIISRPVFFLFHLSLPAWPPSALLFFQHPVWIQTGQIWVVLFLAVHLYYAFKHLFRRYDSTHRGEPEAGSPGEMKWEIVKRRYQEYEQAKNRFHQNINLAVPPTFRYTNEEYAPITEWRGRLLLIRQDALHPQSLPDLSPELAYQQEMYNSHDWFFLDILDYYPKRVMLLHVLLGFGIWLPAVVKVCAWPLLHWRKRIMVADKLVWVCGQAQVHYDRLNALPRYQRPFFSPLPLLEQRLGQLEALIKTEHQWMQDQGLVAKNVEPPILHSTSQLDLRLESRQLKQDRDRL